LYWWGRDAAQVWPVVTAVLIVACPCALALSMPFAYGHTMRLLGRRGLFLRDAEVVERLAHVDTVVFDKTGTLTARESYDLAFEGRPLDAREVMQVRSLARNSAHPLSAEVYRSLQGDLGRVSGVEEESGAGIRGDVEGVPVRLGSAAFCGAPSAHREPGVATVDVAIGGLHRGRFTLRKRVRAGMEKAVGGARGMAATHLLT
ncbi:MAG: heavy metal translocating P-type ATPase, partial [Flavobacteriales bacterium]|nr:heavy metal translocating P-type ATPase [Flavobacteriales bacterium]